MSNLPQDLELLRELNENRRRAKELREQALHALKQIDLEKQNGRRGPRFKYKDKEEKKNGIDFDRWVAADDDIEIALLLKVQNHRELSEDEAENNKPVKASSALSEVLKSLDLNELLPKPGEARNRSSFPVLLAARAMQSLVNRAKTVFEPATMLCYYRIIRELYGVAHPNWTVGAARAGVGGTTSAFVTNECVRAIFAFKNALKRTYEFFEQTRMFYEYFSPLNEIIKEWDIQKGTALYQWADESIKARWLDCQIATNPRNREMALFCSAKQSGTNAPSNPASEEEQKGKNALLLPDEPDKTKSWIENADSYFKELPGNITEAVDQLCLNVKKVHRTIKRFRRTETPDGKSKKGRKGRTDEKKRKEERLHEEKVTKFNRTETAHLFALKTVQDAVRNASALQKVMTDKLEGKEDERRERLENMEKMFYTIRRRVHHVLEPSKQFLKWVLNRELAAPPATFDAGELVFAATSYGAIHNWRMDDRLTRACELLANALPENGRLPTRRPFHADPRGYRTIPIGCEMTRSLATLLQKASYGFGAKFVGRMLCVFEEQLIELNESTAEKPLIGWNFDGAPSPEKPAVWVTAVSVLALDRIVRMLNTRINEIVLAHFDVTKPERPHTQLALRDLIYSDYALVGYGPENGSFKDDERLTAIHLQKARAHVMRATLPAGYRTDNKNFSTIYYGPPGTGKTTLAESLALSARVPLLRLSPGDLILQGQELIEGRAHDVFEALSMLTQCVIIFDEFDAVLRNRGKETKPPKKRTRKDSQHELSRIYKVLQIISEKEDPKFRFVVGGMLPKLIKLHDSAEKQSFAYCLGTNYLSDIDPAAKREGRFDKKMAIYKPDALSRAGILLYWLSQAKNIEPQKTEELKKTPKRADKEIDKSKAELRRFFETIARTVGEPADRISKLFKIEKNEKDKERKPTATLKYIRSEKRQPPEELKGSKANLVQLEKEMRPDGLLLDKKERESKEREWLCKYEKRVVVEEGKLSQQATRAVIITLLNACLRDKL
jgi:hypothetical protein